MTSLHAGRFVIVHLFKFFCGPPECSFRGKFTPKITIFRDFGGCKPTFLKPQRWNLARECRPVTPSPSQIYTKNYQFRRFWGALSPHFKSDNGEIWREGTDLENPPCLKFVKIAQGNLSLVENLYQKFEIFAIFSYLSPYFYTDIVKILLKRTEDLGCINDTKFCQNRSRGLPVSHCLGGDAYWFLVFCFRPE